MRVAVVEHSLTIQKLEVTSTAAFVPKHWLLTGTLVIASILRLFRYAKSISGRIIS